MKVWLDNPASENSGGMYRVYNGLYTYLPQHGIEIVSDKKEADVINAHIGLWGDVVTDKPLVVSSHGMLWQEHRWGKIAGKVNRECLTAYRQADVVTAPSHFVARSIARYTGASPKVVYHGIDYKKWVPAKTSQDYVLWNKSRQDSASNPAEMNELASLAPNNLFYTTHGTEAENVFVFGNIAPDEMYDMVSQAGVYLALSKESGGPCFGVLEAMSCGIPVLSWNFGGTAESIVHLETGYLAEPGNYEDLAEGLQYCLSNKQRLGDNARQTVIKHYGWGNVILGYIDAYDQALYGYNKTVSVVIPCYNLGHFLPGCLDSVIDQTYQNIEIIVVDDASTDNSWNIIQDYARRDSRITPVQHTTNKHVSQARNTGVNYSSGYYILPLDADDRLYPQAIEQLVAGMGSNDIVAGKLHVYHESALEGPFQASGWPNNASLKLQLEGYNRLPYSSLYKRKVWERVGGYRTRIRNGTEDADFWTRALSYGYKARILDDYTLKYTHREVSLGKQNDQGSAVWLSWFPWTEDTSPATATQIKNFSPPQVSIVIPVGPGHLKFLQACVDSVVAQTEDDWEIVVVNDTGEMWGNDLPFSGMAFVRFIDSDTNHGVAYARNRGVEAALSNKIIFLDSDDILQPHAIQALLAAHDYAGGWIYGDWYINTGKGKPEYSESKDWSYDRILNQSLGPITGLYQKDHILKVGGFTEDIPGWEDWEFQLKLLHEGICGTRLKTALITYNMHLGWRREGNFSNRDNLLKYIRDKHYVTLKDKRKMACSGCGGKRTLVIKQTPTTESINLDDTSLLIYQGDNAGRTRINSKTHKGTWYVFSTNKPQFHVFNGDLERLLAMRTPKGTPLFERGATLESASRVVAVAETPLVSEDVPENIPVTVLDLEEHVVNKLVKGGFEYVDQLKQASDTDLLAVKGIGDSRIDTIRKSVETWVSST